MAKPRMKDLNFSCLNDEVKFATQVLTCNLKHGPHQQQCQNNIVEATGNFVACCFYTVAVFGNKVERCFDIIAGVDRPGLRILHLYTPVALKG